MVPPVADAPGALGFPTQLRRPHFPNSPPPKANLLAAARLLPEDGFPPTSFRIPSPVVGKSPEVLMKRPTRKATPMNGTPAGQANADPERLCNLCLDPARPPEVRARLL